MIDTPGRTSPADEPFAGGCLCGKVRYVAGGTPQTPHWCHCGMCRRATGAPAAAFANFPIAEWRVTSGAPATYESSPGIHRGFCRDCGGALFTRADGDALISVLIGSLDAPQRLPPAYHIHDESRVPWLTIADGLPRRAR